MDPAAAADGISNTDLGMIGACIAAIGIQWRANASIVSRMMDKSETLLATVMARSEAQVEAFMGAQAKTTAELAESVHKVETAVIRSDTANVAAIGSLKESVNARLDNHGALHEKHDARFAGHDNEIKNLHSVHAVLDHRVKAIEGKIT